MAVVATLLLGVIWFYHRHLIMTLRVHRPAWMVTAVTFAPDGSEIVVGCFDGVLLFWNANTGVLVRRLETGARNVRCLTFSADGSECAAAMTDGELESEVRIWDVSTWTVQRTLVTRVGYIECLAISPEGRSLAVGGDRGCEIWRLKSEKGHEGLAVSTDPVSSLWFAEEEVLQARCDATIDHFELEPQVRRIRSQPIKHQSANSGWSYTPNSTTLKWAFGPRATFNAAASWSGEAKLLDPKSLAVLATGQLTGTNGMATCLAFSSDETLLAVGTGVAGSPFPFVSAGNVDVFAVPSLTRIATYRAFMQAVRCVAISPDGTRVVTSCNDGTVRVWAVPSTN